MTRASPSSATMSISPSGQRQLRSTMSMPSDSRYSAASSSPRRPSRSLAFIFYLRNQTAGAASAPTGAYRPMWENRPNGPLWRRSRSVAQVGVLGQGKLFVAREFFDVDVLECDDADALHKPGGPVHVPDPGVLEGEVEIDLGIGAARLQVHVVGEVKAALGLDHVAEQPDDIAVFTVELKLHVGFVVFKILGTHGSIL